ncbi:unnamed protein product [Amoebophrya sp. A120]|nr:unnamed protein product [Amoebophrya sp. A120]|eukprot:GSA120T00005823001.1
MQHRHELPSRPPTFSIRRPPAGEDSTPRTARSAATATSHRGRGRVDEVEDFYRSKNHHRDRDHRAARAFNDERIHSTTARTSTTPPRPALVLVGNSRGLERSRSRNGDREQPRQHHRRRSTADPTASYINRKNFSQIESPRNNHHGEEEAEHLPCSSTKTTTRAINYSQKAAARRGDLHSTPGRTTSAQNTSRLVLVPRSTTSAKDKREDNKTRTREKNKGDNMGKSEEPVYQRGDYLQVGSSSGGSSSSSSASGTVQSPRYRVEQLVGHGAFAELYNVYDERSRCNYAVKVEKSRADGNSKLEKESQIQRDLHKALNSQAEYEKSKRIYVPRWHGFHTTDSGPYMVLDLLGRDLSKVRKTVSRHKLSISSVGYLGEQLIRILEKVHDQGIVHRDIKPQNCMLGNCQTTKLNLHLVDFGLAREDFFEDKVHAKPATGVSFRGTAAYASLRSLENVEQGKRDDIEGVFWVFTDLLWGGLPWRRLNLGKSKERDQKIRSGKQMIFDALEDWDDGRLHLKLKAHREGVYSGPIDEHGDFCQTSSNDGGSLIEALPEPMVEYCREMRSLGFNEKPDYSFFAGCFERLKTLGDRNGNLRKKFEARTLREAISKEIYAHHHADQNFNRLTSMAPINNSLLQQVPNTAPVSRKRTRPGDHEENEIDEEVFPAAVRQKRSSQNHAADLQEILAQQRSKRTSRMIEEELQRGGNNPVLPIDPASDRVGNTIYPNNSYTGPDSGFIPPPAAKRAYLQAHPTNTSMANGGSSCSSGGGLTSQAVESVRPTSSADGGTATAPQRQPNQLTRTQRVNTMEPEELEELNRGRGRTTVAGDGTTRPQSGRSGPNRSGNAARRSSPPRDGDATTRATGGATNARTGSAKNDNRRNNSRNAPEQAPNSSRSSAPQNSRGGNNTRGNGRGGSSRPTSSRQPRSGR